MSAVVHSPVASKPTFVVIAEAMAWAQLHRHTVRLRDLVGHGVVCVSSEGVHRWERDKTQAGITAIGCAILQHQPRSTLVPEAAAQALGVSIPEAEGIADALARANRSAVWNASIARHAYARGFEIGALLYLAIASRNCNRHGRFPLTDDLCPLCAQERAADLERLATRGTA